MYAFTSCFDSLSYWKRNGNVSQQLTSGFTSNNNKHNETQLPNIKRKHTHNNTKRKQQ